MTRCDALRALGWLTVAALGSVPFAPLGASAQQGSSATTPASGRRDAHGLWVAVAGESPTMGALGATPGRRFAAVGFRVGKLLSQGKHAALRYTIDYIPLAVTSRPVVFPNHEAAPACVEKLCAEPAPLFGDGTAYGFGASPLGAELIVGPSSPARLLLGVSTGALFFDRPVPITSGTRFNFTASVNVGVAFVGEKGRGVTVGYRLHHLSNGGLATNPGLASHMVVAGFRWGQ